MKPPQSESESVIEPVMLNTELIVVEGSCRSTVTDGLLPSLEEDAGVVELVLSSLVGVALLVVLDVHMAELVLVALDVAELVALDERIDVLAELLVVAELDVRNDVPVKLLVVAEVRIDVAVKLVVVAEVVALNVRIDVPVEM